MLRIVLRNRLTGVRYEVLVGWLFFEVNQL